MKKGFYRDYLLELQTVADYYITAILKGECSKRVLTFDQRYTYRVLQTIQMTLVLSCLWAEPAVLGSAKTTLKFKYEIKIG